MAMAAHKGRSFWLARPPHPHAQLTFLRVSGGEGRKGSRVEGLAGGCDLERMGVGGPQNETQQAGVSAQRPWIQLCGESSPDPTL